MSINNRYLKTSLIGQLEEGNHQSKVGLIYIFTVNIKVKAQIYLYKACMNFSFSMPKKALYLAFLI